MLEQSVIVQKAININLGLNSKQVNSPNQVNLNFEKFKGDWLKSQGPNSFYNSSTAKLKPISGIEALHQIYLTCILMDILERLSTKLRLMREYLFRCN